MGILYDLAKLYCIMAACPSSGYCIAAQRIDCAACPARPKWADTVDDTRPAEVVTEVEPYGS